MVGSSNGETAMCAEKSANFPYKLLLTNAQDSRLHKAFANGLSVNTKLSKIQLSKTILLGQILPLYLLSLYQDLRKKFLPGAKKVQNLTRKAPDEKTSKALDLTNTLKKLSLNDPNKRSDELAKHMGFGITLTNNGKKDIMKVIKFLENSGISLERTNRKISRKKGGFLNFLRPLM